jgi:hypothetical protein
MAKAKEYWVYVERARDGVLISKVKGTMAEVNTLERELRDDLGCFVMREGPYKGGNWIALKLSGCKRRPKRKRR